MSLSESLAVIAKVPTIEVASMGSNTSDWSADQRRTAEKTLWSDRSVRLLVSGPVDSGIPAGTFVKAMA